MDIPTWGGRRAHQALRRVKAQGQANNTPCIICTQPIDYTLQSPHPDSCSVQHIKPRSQFPELTWVPSNWAPAHLVCNKTAGTGTRTNLGVVSNW